MGNPNLESPQDVKRLQILELCEQVAAFDPEFILKVCTKSRDFLAQRQMLGVLYPDEEGCKINDQRNDHE